MAGSSTCSVADPIEELSNAAALVLSTLSTRQVTFVRFVQLPKAFSPMFVTLLGMGLFLSFFILYSAAANLHKIFGLYNSSYKKV